MRGMARNSKTRQKTPRVAADVASKEELVAAYKSLLQTCIDLRPSGTRLKIATALGKHKSFVSQITSPLYAVPVPEAHISTIMTICHFSPEERETFLAAYAAAHPDRSETIRSETGGNYRRLEIDVPLFADPKTQREVESLIRSIAQRVIRLAKRGAP